MLLTLIGLGALGWILAEPLLRDPGTFLPLAPTALAGYLVLRTQWAG